MRPEEALDIKLAFTGWFASKPAAELADMEAEAYAKQGFSNWPQDELDSLRIAQNYWVAPDMVRIAEAAQETLPDEDVLLEEPPSSHGFLVLAEPFTIRCADQECVDDHPFSGLRWPPVHRVLPATKWAEEQHDDGILIQWIGPVVGEEERQFFGSAVAPVGNGMFMPAGRPLQIAQSVEIGAMRPESAVLCRYARTMWTLMQQPLAAVGELEADRPQRRRLQRAGQIPAAPVAIVTLRRKTGRGGNNDETQEVEWSHRWVVRGHWRRQWHPRLQAHRPIWINEHVKGPDDKPLLVREKVITWRR